MIKRVFRLTLRAAQGFIDSIFALMGAPLCGPDYSSVSKRVKPICVSFKTPSRGEIAHLVIDSTGPLKVRGKPKKTARNSVVPGDADDFLDCFIMLAHIVGVDTLRALISRTYYTRKMSWGRRHNQVLIALAKRRSDILFAIMLYLRRFHKHT